MNDLIERLKAAIDADERAALAMMPGPSQPHIQCPDGTQIYMRPNINEPARTLAMVAAHRKILSEHEMWDVGPVTGCGTCDADGVASTNSWPCPTVLALAEAYGI